MGRFVFYFVSSSQDDLKWGLDAMGMQLSLKGRMDFVNKTVCFVFKKKPQRSGRPLGQFII